MKGKAGRKPKPGTRERLIEAADRLFTAQGYDGTSVRDIVRGAGVNLGAVTYHFGGKEDLFSHVVQAKLAPLRRLGEAIVGQWDMPADEKLRVMLRTYAVQILHREPGMMVLMMEMARGGRRLPRVAAKGLAARNALFARVVQEGVRAGLFRPCDAECAAWSFFGMLSAYVLLKPMIHGGGRSGGYPLPYVARVVETALDLFIDGLRTRGVAARKGKRV